MRSNSLRRSAVAAVVVTALGFGLFPSSADAVVNAVGNPSTTVTSASWAAVATSTLPATGASGPLSVTFGLLTPPQYLWVTNTGTVSLASAARYTVAYGISATGIGLGSLQLRACVGGSAVWNETLNTCPGGTIQTLTTTGTAAGGGTIIVPAAVGASVRLQLNPVALSVVVSGSVSVTVTSI
jgi:hypothetical protein